MTDLLRCTFKRFLLISNARDYVYRAREHGSPVCDPIYADTCENISPFLRKMKESANEVYPRFGPWDYAEMKTQIELKSNIESIIDSTIDDMIRQSALKKLSDQEKRVLGLAND